MKDLLEALFVMVVSMFFLIVLLHLIVIPWAIGLLEMSKWIFP